MKKFTKFILIAFFLFNGLNLFSQVKISTENINTPINSSAALEVESSNKGLLLPRVSNFLAIDATPGLVVYDAYNNEFKFYNGSGWLTLKGGIPYTGATENLNLGNHNLSANNLNANTLISTQDITVNGLRIGKGPGTNNSNNIAIGNQALSNNTSGSNNIAIGHRALSADTSGMYNLALGDSTLEKNEIGNFNTALGNRALNNLKVGYRNTANGYNALSQLGNNYNSNLTYNDNTALGFNAGNNLISGSGNIAIGANTNFPSTAGSYQLNIGNEIYGKHVNDPSNDVLIGIGTSDPNFTLDVNGSAKIDTVPTSIGATKALVKNPINGQINEQDINTIIDFPTNNSRNIMKFLLTNDQSASQNFINWSTTPSITLGTSFGTMSNGVFSVNSRGNYKVSITFNLSGGNNGIFEFYSTFNSGSRNSPYSGGGPTRYLQYIGTQTKGTVEDIIPLNANEHIYWFSVTSNTVYAGSSITIEKLN